MPPTKKPERIAKRRETHWRIAKSSGKWHVIDYWGIQRGEFDFDTWTFSGKIFRTRSEARAAAKRGRWP